MNLILTFYSSPNAYQAPPSFDRANTYMPPQPYQILLLILYSLLLMLLHHKEPKHMHLLYKDLQLYITVPFNPPPSYGQMGGNFNPEKDCHTLKP